MSTVAQNFGIAVANRLTRTLYDNSFDQVGGIARILLNMKTAYTKAGLKTNTQGFNGQSIKADKIQVEGVVGAPTWTGVNARAADPATSLAPLKKEMRLMKYTFPAATYELNERLDVAEINALKSGGDGLTDIVKRVTDTIREQAINKISEDTMPSVSAIGSGAGYNIGLNDRVGQLAYMLKTGYANNDTSGSETTFYYGSTNVLTETRFKAYNTGYPTNATGLPATLAAFRKVLRYMRQSRNSTIDLVLVGDATYQSLEAALLALYHGNYSNPGFAEKMGLPGAYLEIDGAFVVWEPTIDTKRSALSLSYDEAYFLNTGTIHVDYAPAAMDDQLVSVRTKSEETLLRGAYQAAMYAGIVVLNPYMNAYAARVGA